MKNQKELQPILTALFVLNRTGENDKEMNLLFDYAFRTFFGSNTNLLSVCCVGKTREEMMAVLKDFLGQMTHYNEYKEGKI